MPAVDAASVMHAEIVGVEDARNLVLLHGGIGTGVYHWSKLVKPLSAQFRVHMPDLPGHGRTPLPPGADYTRALQVEAIRRYLDDIGPPVDVAGFSMGGHACMALATETPEYFASLTLIGVSVREHRGLDGWRRLFDPDVLEREYPVWAKHLSKIHAPQGGPEAWKEVCLRDSRGLQVDLDARALAGVAAPVLLVRGDRDPAVDPSQYAELREALPQADEFVVPGGGHDVQLTRARVFEPVFSEFLQRARRTRQSQPAHSPRGAGT